MDRRQSFFSARRAWVYLATGWGGTVLSYADITLVDPFNRRSIGCPCSAKRQCLLGKGAGLHRDRRVALLPPLGERSRAFSAPCPPAGSCLIVRDPSSADAGRSGAGEKGDATLVCHRRAHGFAMQRCGPIRLGRLVNHTVCWTVAHGISTGAGIATTHYSMRTSAVSAIAAVRSATTGRIRQ